MKRYQVYIVRCTDDSFYVGVTNDYRRRIAEHNFGLDPGCYTYKRRPVELLYVEEFRSVLKAIAREKQLKGWSRKKKEALITGQQEDLMFHAKRPRARKKIRGRVSPFEARGCDRPEHLRMTRAVRQGSAPGQPVSE